MTHYLTNGTPAQALGWEFDAEMAWNYMREVNESALALEADALAQSKTGQGSIQGLLAELFDFMNGPMNVDEEALEFPRGWREWFRSHSSLWSRIWNSSQIVKRTGEYERRLNELYAKFQSLGGKPTTPALEPGYKPPPDKESAEDRLIWWAKFGAIVVGAAYLAPVIIPGLTGVVPAIKKGIDDVVKEIKKPTKLSPMKSARRAR